jgi:pimeloyl-ACP methyl ester carboxylesterase
MKTILTSGYIKSLVLLITLGLSFTSCKDDHPLENPDTNVTDFHQTAQTKFINVDGSQIAYRVLGNEKGLPLILVSSLGSSMDDWDPAITNGLAKKQQVILFDLPGVGSSQGVTPDKISEMAKSVAAFTKALGLAKANFLGFSMGSFITQQIALTQPGLVNRMILTGTGPKGAKGLSDLPKILAATAGLTAEETFLKIGFTSSKSSLAAGQAAYQRIQRRQVDRDKPLSQQSSLAEVTAVLGWAQPDANAFKELEGLSQLALIVQGEFDVAVPVANAVKMSEHLPNAELAVIPDAGHAAFFQSPQQFLTLSFKFLSE